MYEEEYLLDRPLSRIFMKNSNNINKNRHEPQTQPANMFVITRTQPTMTGMGGGNGQQNKNFLRQPQNNTNMIRKIRSNAYYEKRPSNLNEFNARTIPVFVEHSTYDTTVDDSEFMDDIPQVRQYPINRPESTYRIQDTNGNQKLLSEYFPEKKNIDYKKSSQTGKEPKRNLKDLKEKYNIFEVSQDITRNEKTQRSSYADQIANVGSSLKHKLIQMNEQSRDNKNIIHKKRKIEIKEMKKVEPKVIHLMGHVENVLRWNQILKDVQILILYNVLGTFINAMDGVHALEKFVFIRGNNGTILECSFFEMDRPLPKIAKGQFIGCFGDIIGAQRFRLYSIDVLNENERNDTQRAIFLSQRMAHELSNRKSCR